MTPAPLTRWLLDRHQMAGDSAAFHPGWHRQRGAGTVEYMLITGVLVAVLLTPYGQQNASVLKRLMEATHNQQEAYNYSASLPSLPSPDGVADVIDGLLKGAPSGGGGGGNTGDSGTGGGDNPGSGGHGNGGGSAGGGSGDGDQNGEGDQNSDDTDQEGDDGADQENDSGDENDDNQSDTDDQESDGDREGGGEGQPPHGGGGSGGVTDTLDDIRDIVEKFGLTYATYLAGQAMCLTMEDQNPIWTEDDLIALRAARLAYNTTYEADKASFVDNGIEYFKENELEGFSARLLNFNGRWVLAFRGTNMTEGVDWLNNLSQPFMSTAQYNHAVKLANRVQKRLGKSEKVLIAGHSLGGGLAQAASYATGWNAVTFNAAGLSSRYKKDENGKALTPGNIRNHYIIGDPLTTLQTVVLPMLPDASGEQIAHSASCTLGPVARHSHTTFNPPDKPGLERPVNDEEADDSSVASITSEAA